MPGRNRRRADRSRRPGAPARAHRGYRSPASATASGAGPSPSGGPPGASCHRPLRGRPVTGPPQELSGRGRPVAVSASGAFIDDGDGPLTRLIVKPLLQRVLRHPFADTRAMEEEIRATDLAWTIVRPPRLTDGPRTGRYRVSLNRNVRGGLILSRADLADCMLSRLDDPATVSAVVCVGT
ncbi:NAD(P)-binding oxidoreductase [Streptosporangium canum]|uniref:NAD(P)-dependent oxidoreductase n=1 Tax=Streptosporangium canum TaxID=324952 RepID=UPI0033A83CF8